MSLRVSLVALALAITGLAGCVAPAADVETASADVTTLTPGPLSLLHSATGAPLPPGLAVGPVEGALFDVNHIAIEPTLAATADGVLFYAAAQFENPQLPTGDPYTDILRSLDGGQTWEVVTAKLPTGMNNPPRTGDPYVHVDRDTGRVFSLDMYDLACSWITFSDDLGESWTWNPLACGLPPGVHDHQTMTTGKPRASTPSGYPNVVYYCINRVADSACATSLNGGLTFGPLRPLVFPGYDVSQFNASAGSPFGVAFSGLCGGLHGHVVAGPDGTVFLPKEHCGQPAVAISEDDGMTWRISIVNETVGAFGGPDPSVAVDDAGNVYFLWVDTDGFMRLAASADNGRTWGPALNVTAPGVTAAGFPSLAAGAEGRVAFVYMGTEHAGGYAGNPTKDDWESATWNGYLGVITNALDATPVVLTVLANDPSDPLVRGRCGDVRCPGTFDFIDVIITEDGRPYGAFVDACTEKCATPEGKPKDNKYANAPGKVMTLVSGPALRGEGWLAPLPAPAAPAEDAASEA